MLLPGGTTAYLEVPDGGAPGGAEQLSPAEKALHGAGEAAETHDRGSPLLAGHDSRLGSQRHTHGSAAVRRTLGETVRLTPGPLPDTAGCHGCPLQQPAQSPEQFRPTEVDHRAETDGHHGLRTASCPTPIDADQPPADTKGPASSTNACQAAGAVSRYFVRQLQTYKLELLPPAPTSSRPRNSWERYQPLQRQHRQILYCKHGSYF